jgi:hypothetical protein
MEISDRKIIYDYDYLAPPPSGLFSDRLHQVYYAYLYYLLSLDYLFLQQLWYYFPNCVYPNPPCQLSLWEETGAPGENPRLLAEHWLTLFTWVRSENPTHDLRGERRLFWRLRHRSPQDPQPGAAAKNATIGPPAGIEPAAPRLRCNVDDYLLHDGA